VNFGPRIAWGWYQLVLIQLAQGRPDAAALTCGQALDTLVTVGRPSPAAGSAHVGLAGVAYQRNELDAALRHVTEGITLCRQFVYTPPLAAGLVTLAWIRQASGDPAGALDASEEAGQASAGPVGSSRPCEPARRPQTCRSAT
jgi:LuxR family transcriptional regulator, maltose regulon positive regulatory protein